MIDICQAKLMKEIVKRVAINKLDLFSLGKSASRRGETTRSYKNALVSIFRGDHAIKVANNGLADIAGVTLALNYIFPGYKWQMTNSNNIDTAVTTCFCSFGFESHFLN